MSERRICSFCGRLRSRIMAGPGGYICRECVLTLHARNDLAGVAATQDQGTACSFCLRSRAAVPFLMRGQTGAAICESCIRHGAGALQPQGEENGEATGG